MSVAQLLQQPVQSVGFTEAELPVTHGVHGNVIHTQEDPVPSSVYSAQQGGILSASVADPTQVCSVMCCMYN